MIYALIVVAIIWIIGSFIGYFKVFRKWDNNTKFEKIWFSAAWPLLIPLYVIHWFHNNW